jgi:disulfide bond formation protein DsbB|nr:disulfide bond formation protein B [Neorhizobium tomejilense]
MKFDTTFAFSHPLKVVSLVAPATILGALAIERAGYPPCALCLYQRIPYYLLCALFILIVPFSNSEIARRYYLPFALFVLAILIVSGGLGLFHAGVEFSFWKGPSGCSGSIDTTDMKTLLETLRNTKAVSCTKASFWVLGLSLSVWNSIISFGLAGVVVGGLVRRRGV